MKEGTGWLVKERNCERNFGKDLDGNQHKFLRNYPAIVNEICGFYYP